MLGRSGHDTPTKAKGDQIKHLKVFANSENETSNNPCKIVNLYNVLERKTTQMSLVLIQYPRKNILDNAI